jgi:hypothetical protein
LLLETKKKKKKKKQIKIKKKKKNFAKNKMEKISYHTFPDHWDVQLIPSTLCSLEFDSPLAECFTILCSLLACFEGSS